MMATPPASSKSLFENKLLNILVSLGILIGVSVFAYSRGLYYYAQFNWDELFSSVHTFGQSCSIGVGDWQDGDTFQGVLGRPVAMRPLAMPYRAAPPAAMPVVSATEYLRTSCIVDLSKLKATGFGWMRLHYVYGDSAIFLNGRLKETVDDLGIAEFPLTPEDRLPTADLILISRPSSLGAKHLGLPTAMPLFFTDSRAALALPNIGTIFDYNLRPAYWINWSLIFLLIFSVAWLGGLRRPDLGWIVVALASNTLMDALMFHPENGMPLSLRFAMQLSVFSTHVAFGCFALAFTGTPLGSRLKPWIVYFLAVLTYAVLLRLPKGQMDPMIVAYYLPAAIQIALYGSVGISGARRRFRKDTFAHPRRLAFVSSFCLLLAVARFIDVLIYRETFVTFVEVLTELGMTGFCVFLIFDLVVSYRRYLSEKLRHLETQTRSREFEAIARVTQMLAHDVRKPYQILAKGLDSLERQGRFDKAATGRVRQEVERALAETNGMLADIMDIGAKPSQSRERASVAALVLEALTRAFALSPKPQVNLVFALSGSDHLNLDTRRFLRVLVNLLENAIQATTADGTLRVSSSTAELNGKPALSLALWNSGSYVTAEDLPRLFDPFFTKNKSQGTGLGLAIVAKFVHAEGGRIHCESKEGEGTSFVLTLPIPEERNSGIDTTTAPVRSWPKTGGELALDATAPSAFLPAAAAPTGERRIAVIDDDVFVREMWETLAGWQVVTFAYPDSFWRAAAEAPQAFIQSFDYIVTDYYFGRSAATDGAAFARALRQAAPNCRIILSSDVELSGERLVDHTLFLAQISKDIPSNEDLEAWAKAPP